MVQKNQFLLRFLKLRVVVNGNYIYPLARNKPVVIDMPTNPSKLVVTDGFHITKPIEITYTQKYTRYFKIACSIEDDQLIIGLVIIGLLYAMGATSGMVFLQVLSIAPVFYFIFLYYVNRKEFIQLRPA